MNNTDNFDNTNNTDSVYNSNNSDRKFTSSLSCMPVNLLWYFSKATLA